MSPEQADFKSLETSIRLMAECMRDNMAAGVGAKTKHSTIRIQPKIVWPKLDDKDSFGREVEEFFDKFESICQLANDGRGMSDTERLTTLGACLSGSKAKIYETNKKRAIREGTWESKSPVQHFG